MNIKNIILGSCICLAGFVSCSDDNDVADGSFSGPMGVLVLKVETNSKVNVITPEIGSRAESGNSTINQFPVTIYNSKGDSIIKNYVSYSAMDNEVKLPVGTYKVVAHSPGEMETKMSSPYFQGEETLEIKKDIIKEATVTCKMKNIPVKLNYNADFINAFESWSIILNDGNNHVLEFDSNNKNPETIYWAVGDETKVIIVNVTAKNKNGQTLVESYRCTKSSAEEDHMGVSEYFGGGDGITINFTPVVENAKPGAGIDMSVDLTWTTDDKNDGDVIVDVEIGTGSTDNGDNTGNGDGTNDTNDTTPSIELPADFTYSLSGNPAKPTTANAIFKTPEGLSSAIVKIETDNADFEKTLAEAAFDTPGALLEGAQMIGNEGLENLFKAMFLTDSEGQPKATPKDNDKSYEFPIHAFYKFLDIYEGKHTFTLSLEDKKGQKANESLTITITE